MVDAQRIQREVPQVADEIDDWHVAKVKTGLEDQKIRVIVVKMPYKE